MNNLLMITMLFILASCGPISKTELATDILLIIDRNQTIKIEDHPGLYETNLILSPNPTRKEVDQYFTGVIALNTLIHRDWTWFPRVNYYRKKLLPYYQGGLLAVEVKAIHNNYSFGLSGNF